MRSRCRVVNTVLSDGIDPWPCDESGEPFRQAVGNRHMEGCYGLSERTKTAPQPPDPFDQRANAQDLHHALEVVGEYMQTHLGAHSPQRLTQKVCGPHPRLDGAERMLSGLATQAHLLAFAIQARVAPHRSPLRADLSGCWASQAAWLELPRFGGRLSA
jgi:hypothetical protein